RTGKPPRIHGSTTRRQLPRRRKTRCRLWPLDILRLGQRGRKPALRPQGRHRRRRLARPQVRPPRIQLPRRALPFSRRAPPLPLHHLPPRDHFPPPGVPLHRRARSARRVRGPQLPALGARPRRVARRQPRLRARPLPGFPRPRRILAPPKPVLVVQLHPAQPRVPRRRMNLLRRLWLPVAYYLSWLLFALGGLALNLCCAPFLLARDRERFGPPARAATRRLFDSWLGWMHLSGILEIVWTGFENPSPRGVVYVANHPTLVDAPFLLARLPDTVCIFKPALLRNPVIAPAALLCGYVSGDAGVDGIRRAAEAVASGRSLLIFPEGTRTEPGATLNPLKPGAALIARRAGAPLRLIHVRSSPLMARKGHPWWKLPPLPGRFEFTLGEQLSSDTSPAELTA